MTHEVTSLRRIGSLFRAARDGAWRYLKTDQSIWFVVGTAAYVPGLVYAENVGALNRGYRLGVYILVIVASLLLLVRLLDKAGLHGTRAMIAVGFGWLIVSTGASVKNLLGGHDGFYIAAVVVVAAGAYRAARIAVSKQVFFILTVVLIGSPVAGLGLNSLQLSSSATAAVIEARNQAAQFMEQREDHPDVWFVLVDGYPSASVLRSLYDYERPELGEFLEDQDFAVNRNALSPYAMTHLSFPALLNGRVLPEVGIGRGEMSSLRRVIGGRSRLRHDLKAQGYETTFVENGWHLSSCGDVENCVRAPILDEQLGSVMEQSLMGSMLRIDQSTAAARGVHHTIEWMERLPDVTNANGVQDLVVLHLMVPHPPFSLSNGCSHVAPTGVRSGRVIANPDTDSEVVDVRRQLFVDQVECVSGLIAELVESLVEGTIIAVVGDHGPDSYGQLALPVADWTPEMIHEGLLTIAALWLTR